MLYESIALPLSYIGLIAIVTATFNGYDYKRSAFPCQAFFASCKASRKLVCSGSATACKRGPLPTRTIHATMSLAVMPEKMKGC